MMHILLKFIRALLIDNLRRQPVSFVTNSISAAKFSGI